MIKTYKSQIGQKGFTLIELLVVIAIIGLLAAVVLASVGSARSKGVDATVKGQLNTARSQAELYSSSNSNSYGAAGALCTATQANNGLASILTNAGSATGATQATPYGTTAEINTSVFCNSTATTWMVQAPLSTSGNFWCVDSTGASKSETVAALANATACI